ncbi:MULTISPECIES: ABC transporter permease [Brachybacterium]|uniref:Peptide ABC transporter permease n=1 Tax=Brachybacterium alimentarium TaxID=47845 RepID=A0A2A3YG58_9MICO|nr:MULTISPECIES: ABC transporter permease [Brachybacterium]PCC38274.1 peptide ABC transporter permease [Brachybacterium alimentarium]RCS64046.1 ABC transporter permease [Brachybacterium sp. JB7]RCS71909.1 ABC transporter permease [Brachybacterium alimentarium]RCS80014.1 ABC transporter permease [Brachybacterium alimentarium]RCS88741.1 ABC transporter permease [Brachybacterium alimentarium]
MKLGRYIAQKTVWYLVALVAAVSLNFLLPRLVPGNPVDVIVSNLSRGGSVTSEQQKQVYESYVQEFGLDQSLGQQFLTYLGKVFTGDLGTSFAYYPAAVNDLVGQALPWSIAVQLPAILIGWILGNVIGAIAAFRGGNWDRSVFTTSLFLSAMPYYCLSILLLYVLAVVAGVFPVGGAYSLGLSPEFSVAFLWDALSYYWLPFLSLVVVFIGGQAVGMRSMAIYELGGDYVSYARAMGIRDNKITQYIFRNAMLPQITGLALAIGTLVGGALITELVFSYPGVGTLLFNAIAANDYPVIQAVTLIITVAVLLANFAVEIAYGIIDPRIRAAKSGEK